jgi:dephospho-CoA kinase
MILIGLTGEIGSGKTLFYDLLKEVLPQRKIALVNYSDTLKDTLTLWFLEQTRMNFKKLATALNTNFGGAALGHATLKRALSQDAEVVVMAGLRWNGDLERLRAYHGLLVYVTADIKIRFERVRIRKEKTNEQGITFDKFVEENNAPNEISVTRLGAQADFRIDNNGSLDEFREKIRVFVREFLG